MFQQDYWERKSLQERRDPDHPVVRAYVEPKLDWVAKFLPLTPQTLVLDLGAGNGFFSHYWAKRCRTLAADFSLSMLSRNPVPLKARMAAERLAFPDMAFDIVFCHALLHHVEDLDRVLSEMKRVSRGYLVVMEPNPMNPLMGLFSAMIPEERKALAFRGNFLKHALERQGLKVTASCAFGLLVPNKTPGFLLPLLKPFNFPFPLGMTRILVAKRK